MSKLYFFRHAQASFGSDNYDQLSPKGLEQSEQLGQYLINQNIEFDKVYVGPLIRQRHTLELVRQSYEKVDKVFPKVQELSGLKEHQGPDALKKYLPKLIQEVPQVELWYKAISQYPNLKRKNSLLTFEYFINEWVQGKINVEEVESWISFKQNVSKTLNQILAKTSSGQSIGIFTSGGTISCIVAKCLAIQDDLRIASLNFNARNTSITSFLYTNNKFNLLSFNEVQHLDKDMITFV